MANISNELLDKLEIDDIITIAMDALDKVKPADSKLKYKDEHHEYRKIVEAEIDALPEGQVVEFPKV